MAEPLTATTAMALRQASLANLEALAHLLEAMRASIGPATRPHAIRTCLQAVRRLVQLTETVECLEPATPDDNSPTEVRAHSALLSRAGDLRRQAATLGADLMKALDAKKPAVFPSSEERL